MNKSFSFRKQRCLRTNYLLASLILLSIFLTSSSVSHHKPRFEDLYECYVISDAEVSYYDNPDEFEQIDYEELLDIVRHARYKPVAFERAWLINLYDDEGIRYNLSVSRSCRFVRVDANSFQLSRCAARHLEHLLPK